MRRYGNDVWPWLLSFRSPTRGVKTTNSKCPPAGAHSKSACKRDPFRCGLHEASCFFVRLTGAVSLPRPDRSKASRAAAVKHDTGGEFGRCATARLSRAVFKPRNYDSLLGI